MNRMDPLIPALWAADLLFRHSHRTYRAGYFAYKKLSDRKKIQLIRSRVRPGMRVLDVGANIGFYSLLFSSLVGEEGAVYAFEPEPLNFAALAGNVRGLSNVNLKQAAVGQSSGRIGLYKCWYLNVLHTTFDAQGKKPSAMVPCVALDDWLDPKHRVDFIKMDIEGFDLHALMGMQDTLKRSEKCMLLGEIWPFALERAGTSAALYLDFLRQAGFSARLMPDVSLETLAAKAGNPLFRVDVFAQRQGKDLEEPCG